VSERASKRGPIAFGAANLRVQLDLAKSLFEALVAERDELDQENTTLRSEVRAVSERLVAAEAALNQLGNSAYRTEKLEAAYNSGLLSRQASEADLQMLQLQKNAMLNARSANANARTEYLEKVQELEVKTSLQRSLTASIEENDARAREMREQYLAALQSKLGAVSAQFTKYFRAIGCNGEVTLNSEMNSLEEWELILKVSFREGREVQRLSATFQSGGERSVSTMLFLLCLQRVTNTPFRVVDEINQGMDSHNERMIFKQIADSSRPHEAGGMLINNGSSAQANVTPQYFLVTPKLLPNLSHHDRIMVFLVYNGKMVPQEEWMVRKFVEAIRAH
jgi:chromosome segregation ATPase